MDIQLSYPSVDWVKKYWYFVLIALVFISGSVGAYTVVKGYQNKIEKAETALRILQDDKKDLELQLKRTKLAVKLEKEKKKDSASAKVISDLNKDIDLLDKEIKALHKARKQDKDKVPGMTLEQLDKIISKRSKK